MMLHRVCSYVIMESPVDRLLNHSYWSSWNMKTSPRDAPWKTANGVLMYNDREFIVRGANLNGFESDGCRVLLGLADKPMAFFLDFLHTHQFNTLRIPLSFEVMADLQLKIGNCTRSEPALQAGTSTVEFAVSFLLDEAWRRGMFVLFDLHTIGGVITPMPWTEAVNENMVTEAWLLFLRRFHKHPALMGIEIKNEPHDTITLDVFLEHCAKVIRNIETYIPDFKGLYFISGIQRGGPWGGAFDPRVLTAGFAGLTHPSIVCTVDTPPDRLVFNPHVYGPGVRGEDAATEGPEAWETQYGFITSMNNHWNSSAILPTEIGGIFNGTDRSYYDRWLLWHTGEKRIRAGAFWWTTGPFSADTGGLFEEDYSVNWEKVNFMKRLVPYPTRARVRHLRRSLID